MPLLRKAEADSLKKEFVRLGAASFIPYNQIRLPTVYNDILLAVVKQPLKNLEKLPDYRPDKKVTESKNYYERLYRKLVNPDFDFLLNKSTFNYISDRFRQEIETNKKRKLEDKKSSEQKALKKIVVDFQNGNSKKLILDGVNIDEDLPTIVKALRVKPGYATMLSATDDYKKAPEKGDTFITVNDKTLPTLKKAIYNMINEVHEEDQKDSSSDFVINYAKRYRYLIIEQHSYVGKKKRPTGAFFPYLCTLDIDFSKYGIFQSIKKENYRINCLQQAFISSGLFTKEKLDYLNSFVKNRDVPIKDLKNVADKLECHIELRKHDTDNTYHYGDKTKTHIKIGLFKDHYYLIDRTNLTSYMLMNYKQVYPELKDKTNWNKLTLINKKLSETEQDKYYLSSNNLINGLLKYGFLTPITLSTDNILSIQFYDKVDTIDKLDYPKKCSQQITANTKKLLDSYKIFYADFETITDGKIHEAYLACVSDEDGKVTTFEGNNCGKALYNFLPKKSIVYYHNLGYDISFLTEHTNLNSIIRNGTRIKTCRDLKKDIRFMDSLSMITEPLKKFPEMFDLKVKKEVMPYRLYNRNTINKKFVDIKEAISYLDDPTQKDEFIQLAIQNDCLNGLVFDHFKYARFYCIQDTNVLREGFKCFRNFIKQITKLDPIYFISLPSLSYEFGIKSGVFDGVTKLSGIPQSFIQQCVVGGRCMTSNNKQYHTTVPIDDFDAVALYPSAMTQMGFLKGPPIVLEPDQLNMNFLNTVSGYFIEITNIICGKHLNFPLQSKIIKGIRQFSNTFDSKDKIYLDKYATEDFIRFQQATFTIVKGYYYNSGRNYKISDMMKKLSDERQKFKKVKNPIEQVYKLLMNSFYGKTITKPHNTDTVIKNTTKQHEDYLRYNYNFIKSYTIMGNNKYSYEVIKPIDDHFNSCQVGSEILSMSKRLMNQVMCLAEDLNITIYYQDTDSMHIEKSKIQQLSTEFKLLYGKDLIGKELCQFHEDFNPSGSYAIESYFIGKKCYIDKLLTLNGKIQYHIRLKGIPSKCVTNKVEELKYDSPLQLFKDLYEGKKITFDLTTGTPCFKRNKDFTYSTQMNVKRSIQFNPQNMGI